MRTTFLILHNIRSVHNVGAIFRTADAAGVDKIFLTGYTPTPVDRFGRARTDLKKTALGAEKSVAWKYEKDLSPLLKKLKMEGYEIIAMEQSKNSVDYKKIKVKEKIAIVVGNEVDGLSEEILTDCDIVAEIKMRGGKESLNVSVATGIALFRMLNL